MSLLSVAIPFLILYDAPKDFPAASIRLMFSIIRLLPSALTLHSLLRRASIILLVGDNPKQTVFFNAHRTPDLLLISRRKMH